MKGTNPYIEENRAFHSSCQFKLLTGFENKCSTRSTNLSHASCRVGLFVETWMPSCSRKN